VIPRIGIRKTFSHTNIVQQSPSGSGPTT